MEKRNPQPADPGTDETGLLPLHVALLDGDEWVPAPAPLKEGDVSLLDVMSGKIIGIDGLPGTGKTALAMVLRDREPTR